MKKNCINPVGPVVIAGFPGIGKSTFAKEMDERFYPEYIEVVDTDPVKFKENWPEDYINHICTAVEYGKTSKSLVIILISTHKEVLHGLIDRNIQFSVVYPYYPRKEEYIKRYREGGGDEKICTLLNCKWDELIHDIDSLDSILATKVKVGHEEYIEDIFECWMEDVTTDPSMILLPFGTHWNSVEILTWLFVYLISDYDFGYSYYQINKILNMIETGEFNTDDDDITYVRVCQLIENRYLSGNNK